MVSSLTLATAKRLSERFDASVDPLCKAIAHVIAKNERYRALLLMVYHHLRRTMARFARIAERAALGTPTPPREPSLQPAETRTRTRTPKPQLPRSYAWLLQLVPGCGNYGSQLRHFLETDPEMASLLEASPEMQRLFRPLLHMLAADTPKVPRRPSQPRPRPASPDTTPRPARKPRLPWHYRFLAV